LLPIVLRVYLIARLPLAIHDISNVFGKL